MCKLLFTRPFLKDFLPCHLYSEGSLSRIKKLRKEIKDKSILSFQQNTDFKKNEKSHKLFNFIRKIVTFFELIFKKKYESVFELKYYLEMSFFKNSKALDLKGLKLLGVPDKTEFSTILY